VITIFLNKLKLIILHPLVFKLSGLLLSGFKPMHLTVYKSKEFNNRNYHCVFINLWWCQKMRNQKRLAFIILNEKSAVGNL